MALALAVAGATSAHLPIEPVLPVVPAVLPEAGATPPAALRVLVDRNERCVVLGVSGGPTTAARGRPTGCTGPRRAILVPSQGCRPCRKMPT